MIIFKFVKKCSVNYLTPQLATKRVETAAAHTAAALLSLDTPLKYQV